MHLPGETQPTVITRVFFEEQEGQVSRLPQLVEAALIPETIIWQSLGESHGLNMLFFSNTM